jgi:hypothetical protein
MNRVEGIGSFLKFPGNAEPVLLLRRFLSYNESRSRPYPFNATLVSPEVPAMNESQGRGSFTWREFRRWRMLQIAALLPLIVLAAFMLYFKTAPALGVIVFFLVLIIGVLLPQLKADSVLSYLLLKEEIKEELGEMIREETRKALQQKSEE